MHEPLKDEVYLFYLCGKLHYDNVLPLDAGIEKRLPIFVLVFG